MADDVSPTGERKPSRQARKCADIGRILVKEEVKARFKQVEKVLKKNVDERSLEDIQLLELSHDVVEEIQKRARIRDTKKQRTLEIEDSAEELDKKCEILVKAIEQAKNLIVYTGAGISTAASIPDYRGPNGVWTLLQQGKNVEAQDLSDAIPTKTHMGLTQLYNEGLVKYVVSQNCDGLHLRSGLPSYALSEVHGNMYIEHCTKCKPARQYIRLFDVTERTALHRHKTERFCPKCGNALLDSIIHFGEKSRPDSVYQWPRAAKLVEKGDMILCLGSSLKVLKKYSHLWSMDVPLPKRPKVFIVNLQWTPKDEVAALKINGQCDIVMEKIMKIMGLKIPPYTESCDPIFYLHTPLKEDEKNAVSKKLLKIPEKLTPPQWVFRKDRQSKKQKTNHRGSRKRKPDDNPPTKATKIKKEDLLDAESCESSLVDLPSPDHNYASSSPKSGYSRSNSPRSSGNPHSPRSLGSVQPISPRSVKDYVQSVHRDNPSSPNSDGSLGNLIDEVVMKFADDTESPNLSEYLGSSGDDDREEVLAKTKEPVDFLTTRWLLSQPPMYNMYSQFRVAAPVLRPPFPLQFPPRFMFAPRQPLLHPAFDMPTSSSSGVPTILNMLQSQGPRTHPALDTRPPSQSMNLPVFIKTEPQHIHKPNLPQTAVPSSHSPVSSSLPGPSQPVIQSSNSPDLTMSIRNISTQHQKAPVLSSSITATQCITSEAKSSIPSTQESGHGMASKYPILTGYIKIAEEEEKLKTEETEIGDGVAPFVSEARECVSDLKDRLTKPDTSDRDSRTDTSNLGSLIDEVVDKYSSDLSDSEKVRKKLFHHIKRRSSQNLLGPSDSPAQSPSPTALRSSQGYFTFTSNPSEMQPTSSVAPCVLPNMIPCVPPLIPVMCAPGVSITGRTPVSFVRGIPSMQPVMYMAPVLQTPVTSSSNTSIANPPPVGGISASPISSINASPVKPPPGGISVSPTDVKVPLPSELLAAVETVFSAADGTPIQTPSISNTGVGTSALDTSKSIPLGHKLEGNISTSVIQIKNQPVSHSGLSIHTSSNEERKPSVDSLRKTADECRPSVLAQLADCVLQVGEDCKQISCASQGKYSCENITAENPSVSLHNSTNVCNRGCAKAIDLSHAESGISNLVALDKVVDKGANGAKDPSYILASGESLKKRALSLDESSSSVFKIEPSNSNGSSSKSTVIAALNIDVSASNSSKKECLDIDESSKSSTGSDESKASKGKKEVSSVPGWFGKGLKKYKKRR